MQGRGLSDRLEGRGEAARHQRTRAQAKHKWWRRILAAHLGGGAPAGAALLDNATRGMSGVHVKH